MLGGPAVQARLSSVARHRQRGICVVRTGRVDRWRAGPGLTPPEPTGGARSLAGGAVVDGAGW
jgi:hypothetical protein